MDNETGFDSSLGRLVTEGGVGDRDKGFGALPDALALQIHHAIFRLKLL